ncbi:unnamed protein product, partial [Iphiclides podalirius]
MFARRARRVYLSGVTLTRVGVTDVLSVSEVSGAFYRSDVKTQAVVKCEDVSCALMWPAEASCERSHHPGSARSSHSHWGPFITRSLPYRISLGV